MYHSPEGLSRLRESGRKQALKRWGKRTVRERFLAYVAVSDGCWMWTGNKNYKGYGQFGITSRCHKYAHRFMWELEYGPVPDGYSVCHHCDTRACVRPDHLFIGTNADNVADKMRKGRHKSPSGEAHPNSKLTLAQVEQMRSEFSAGDPAPRLARRYGIDLSHTHQILKHRVWR